MFRPGLGGASLLLLTVLGSSNLAAQERIALESDLLFYADNTEFSNPFREGETIFGAAARIGVAFDLNDRVTLLMGAFGNQRFGSDDAFEQVRPVLSLTVSGKRSSFVFGTLPALTVSAPVGPDRGGPHALLPPLQRETLSFDRPYEAGLAWIFTGTTVHNSFWLNWQRLNTAEHRERFDGGFNGSLRVSSLVSIPFQIHVVHEGGQLYDSGPVADSSAAALGVDVHGTIATRYRASIELFGVGSRYVPDRSRPDLSRDGIAFFGRVAAERANWRAHVIFWRGRNFIKDEGDPNYLSIRQNGVRYRGTRDYAEIGLAKRFKLAPSAILEAAGRFHRIETHYEYSYRILSIVSPSWRFH
ncbi:MAG TPA: hypothetical protein VH702_08670 [Vicinamibacterales bacterium]|jgi:hypothetical protein